jgi:hypothetical protein
MKYGETGIRSGGLRRSVRQHLDSLGDSPGRISDRLRAEGVKGVPGESRNCALARYLQAVIGAEQSVTSVSVFERSIRIRRPGFHPPTFVTLPKAASAFIRDFDTGSFPELIDRLRSPRGGVKGSPTASAAPSPTQAQPGDSAS